MRTSYSPVTFCLFSLSVVPAMALDVNSKLCLNDNPPTIRTVEAVQKGWGEGIVAIGKAKDPKAAAIKHLDTFYSYDARTVLFKPTKASKNQFRNTKEEALSYFVGGVIPEDKGFALAPYTKVRFDNHGVVTKCNIALAMGNYYFTKTNGDEIKVEYSFAYIQDEKGNLKIKLHHSSLPF